MATRHKSGEKSYNSLDYWRVLYYIMSHETCSIPTEKISLTKKKATKQKQKNNNKKQTTTTTKTTEKTNKKNNKQTQPQQQRPLFLARKSSKIQKCKLPAGG